MQHSTSFAAVLIIQSVWLTTADDKKFQTLDLQPKANVKLTDDFHAEVAGNNLVELKQGDQQLGDVKFTIGEKCIQLGSPILKENGRDFPASVRGIEVNSTFAKLHLLHAVGFGIAYEAQPETLPKDKVIAKLKVVYDDGSNEVLPIVYGEDVCDWWYIPGSQYHHREPSRAKIAWEGTNGATRMIAEQENIKVSIRLYLTTWTNPKPEKKVKTLEFATADPELPSAPFCVAITTEGR